MEFLEPIIERCLIWIKKRKPLIRFLLLITFFILAATVYCLGFFKVFQNENLNDILKDFGRIVFATGVVVAVVKSILFLEIFKDALGQIIFFDKNYLAKQNNIRDIWASISKALYNQKFAEISDDIEKVVLEKYFPTDHQHYYNFILFEIELKPHSTNNYIEITEVVTYEARSSDKNQEIKFWNNSSIDLDSTADTVTSYLMEEIRVDQDSYSVASHFKTKVEEKKLKGDLSLTLSGKDQYSIRLKKRKVFSLKNNLETKSFITTRICKQMEVVVNYPMSIKLDFYEEGTIEKFVPLPIDNPPVGGYNRIAMRSNSIIFPKQGFRIIFSKC